MEQVHLFQYDDEEEALSARVYSHVPEIWSISATTARPGVVATCACDDTTPLPFAHGSSLIKPKVKDGDAPPISPLSTLLEVVRTPSVNSGEVLCSTFRSLERK